MEKFSRRISTEFNRTLLIYFFLAKEEAKRERCVGENMKYVKDY